MPRLQLDSRLRLSLWSCLRRSLYLLRLRSLYTVRFTASTPSSRAWGFGSLALSRLAAQGTLAALYPRAEREKN